MSKLSLRAKLIVGFSIVLTFLICLGLLSVSRFLGIQKESAQMMVENENRLFAVSKEIDHLNWVQGLSELFLREDVHFVTVETDHTKCSLGLWMYGGELEKLSSGNARLSALVHNVKLPHENLHKSAIHIDELYEHYDQTGYDQLVAGWIAHLEWMKLLSSSVIDGSRFLGGLDHRNCSFGRWYYSYTSDDPRFNQLLDSWETPHSRLHEIAAQIVDFQTAGNTSAAQRLFSAEILPTLDSLEQAKNQTLSYLDGLKDNQESAMAVFDDETVPSLENTQEALKDLVGYFEDRSSQAVNTMAESIQLVILLIASISTVATIVAVVLAIITIRSIISQLGVDPRVLENVASQVSRGDLEIHFSQDQHIRGVYESVKNMVHELQYKASVLDEIGRGNFAVDVGLSSRSDSLGSSMLHMKNSMSGLLREIQLAATQVSISAEQIALASQSLSQGATQQAASLEEISSSLTQVNSQTQSNNANAQEADGIARQSALDAETGNRQMAELVQAMEEISGSSREIQQIIKVIDDIAFQTNLLALNANVEAARSGKYGKGFAVVADEVRNLANRSANAVHDTNEKVGAALKSIAKGDELVKSTAGQLQRILEGSKRVSGFMQDMAKSTGEQAMAISQVSLGLDQIEQVTQANTASAEESSSAAEELSGQARMLEEMVGRFQIGDEGVKSSSWKQSQIAAPRETKN